MFRCRPAQALVNHIFRIADAWQSNAVNVFMLLGAVLFAYKSVRKRDDDGDFEFATM